jgi:hypothetical protein
MPTLEELMRRSMETDVEVGDGRVIVVRRPTHLEFTDLGPQLLDRSVPAIQHGRLVFPYIVGWKKFRPVDLVPGGGPEEAPFELGACSLWLENNLGELSKVIRAVLSSYTSDANEKAEAEKN